jgi:uncharacterized protein (DUF1015 family)
MVRLETFTGALVEQTHAADVIAPPYDRLTPIQRRAIAAAQPDSFLAVLPAADTDIDELQANRAALDRLRRGGRFRPLTGPCLAVLSLEHDGGTAVAVVGDVEVADFESGAIRSHEQVRPARVEQLTRYLDVVGIASSPVALVHRDDPDVAAAVATVVRRAAPDLHVALPDATILRVWLVADPVGQQDLRDAFASVAGLTIADGHHRAAAGAAFAAASGPGRAVDRILVAAFPASQLSVAAFDRRISGLGADAMDRITALLRSAGLEPIAIEPPTGTPPPHVAHLGLESAWWSIALAPALGAGPLGRLDAAVVERVLLEPLAHQVPTVTVEPVAAEQDHDGRASDPPGPGRALVRLHPPDVDAIIAVARAGAIMPAKSTYLGPKLRSGVFLVPRRGE